MRAEVKRKRATGRERGKLDELEVPLERGVGAEAPDPLIECVAREPE